MQWWRISLDDRREDLWWNLFITTIYKSLCCVLFRVLLPVNCFRWLIIVLYSLPLFKWDIRIMHIFLGHFEFLSHYVYISSHAELCSTYTMNHHSISNRTRLIVTRVASHLTRSDTPSITCIVACLSCSDTLTYPSDQWQARLHDRHSRGAAGLIRAV